MPRTDISPTCATTVTTRPRVRAAMVTQLFPNPAQPTLGTFNAERARFLAELVDLDVVAPVPWYPRHMPGPERWRRFANLALPCPSSLRVLHPRRIVVPTIGDRLNPYLYERVLLRTVSALHRERALDVIDAHVLWPDGWAAVRVGRALGIPVVVTAHGSDLTLMPRFASIHRQIGETLRAADRVVAVSSQLAHLACELGASPRRVGVIPNGVDPERFRPRDRRRCRARLGLSGDEFVVLGVGSLDANKGFELVVPALAALRRRGLRCGLVLIGDGPRRDDIARAAARHGVDAHVRFAGPVPHDDVALHMAAADLLVLPSAREGWPTVLHEAWACGTPVLATDVGGVAEAMAGRADLGHLLPDREAGTIERGLTACLMTRWDRDALRAHAIRWTWERVARAQLRTWRAAAGIPS